MQYLKKSNEEKCFFEITGSCSCCLTSHINCPCVAKCIYCIPHIVPISINVYMHVYSYIHHCAYLCVQKSPQIHAVVSSGLWQKLISWLYDCLSLSVCLCFCLLGCLTPVTKSHALEQRAVNCWKAFTLPLSWLVDLVLRGVPWRLSCELTHASCGRLLGPHDGAGGCVFKHQTLPETKTL